MRQMHFLFRIQTYTDIPRFPRFRFPQFCGLYVIISYFPPFDLRGFCFRVFCVCIPTLTV